jgi:hypothetical protein
MCKLSNKTERIDTFENIRLAAQSGLADLALSKLKKS